ncbi:MAG TPA: CopG family antitoxin [Anaerolineae bacterium]|nr:CopG family antitoxin [Anaerolineae bacterium]
MGHAPRRWTDSSLGHAAEVTSAGAIRLPISLLEDLKSLANARDVPYQSMMKILPVEQVAQIRRR